MPVQRGARKSISDTRSCAPAPLRDVGCETERHEPEHDDWLAPGRLRLAIRDPNGRFSDSEEILMHIVLSNKAASRRKAVRP